MYKNPLVYLSGSSFNSIMNNTLLAVYKREGFKNSFLSFKSFRIIKYV